MKILYVCGTHYPTFGGAEKSADTLLLDVARRGHSIAIVTRVAPAELGTLSAPNPLPPLFVGRSEPLALIHAAIDAFRPDAVLTQLTWSDKAIVAANTTGIPSILRVCKIPTNVEHYFSDANSGPTHVVTASDAVRRDIESRCPAPITTITPSIEISHVRASASNPDTRPFITMFNPIAMKGGYIFREIARMLPRRQFAFVRGWHFFRDTGGRFDHNLISDLCTSIGETFTDGQMLDEPDFTELENVTELAATPRVRDIYSRTRLLCVPSQEPEAFGRVVPEAFANHIPVLGSDLGGLGELLRTVGTAVKGYSDPTAWVAAIEALDDHIAYRKAALRAAASASKHCTGCATADRFLDVVDAAIAEKRRG